LYSSRSTASCALQSAHCKCGVVCCSVVAVLLKCVKVCCIIVCCRVVAGSTCVSPLLMSMSPLISTRASAKQYIAVHCSALQCIAVFCSMLQCVECVTICCNVLPCTAVRHSVLQCFCSVVAAITSTLPALRSTRPFTVLQYVAECCSVLQCFTVCCSVDAMQWVPRCQL